MFWGFSEALDLWEEYSKVFPNNQSSDYLNVLLIGAGDCRHILKSLAKRHHHSKRISFHIAELTLEIYARDMLLLLVALEQPQVFSLTGKCHLFMDIYGNALLRPSSYNYICSKAEVLTRMITDLEYASSIAPIFNLENLSYGTRDHLENVFNFWRHKVDHIFDIDKYWDIRLRQMLGIRYDHAVGAFDWDLQMRLRDNGVTQICSQEYRHFRQCGVAFTFPEYEQCCPNKTIVANLVRMGKKFQHHGYLGDMVIGPFTVYGLKCADKKMMQSQHGNNAARSTDVTEFNLTETLHEIQDETSFDVSTAARRLGFTHLELGKNMPSEIIGDVNLKKYDEPILELSDRIRVEFLGLKEVIKFGELAKKFDVIFVGVDHLKLFQTAFKGSILKDEALIVFETKQYSTLTPKQVADHLGSIKEVAAGFNFEPVTHFNINVPLPTVRYKKCQQLD